MYARAFALLLCCAGLSHASGPFVAVELPGDAAGLRFRPVGDSGFQNAGLLGPAMWSLSGVALGGPVELSFVGADHGVILADFSPWAGQGGTAGFSLPWSTGSQWYREGYFIPAVSGDAVELLSVAVPEPSTSTITRGAVVAVVVASLFFRGRKRGKPRLTAAEGAGDFEQAGAAGGGGIDIRGGESVEIDGGWETSRVTSRGY